MLLLPASDFYLLFAWICTFWFICLQFNQARCICLLWHLPWNWGRWRLCCSQGRSKRGIRPKSQGCILLGFCKWHIQSDQWYRSVTNPFFYFFTNNSVCLTAWKCIDGAFCFCLRWRKSACWRTVRDKTGYMAHAHSYSKGKKKFYLREEKLEWIT